MYDLCSSNAPAPLDLQRTPELPPISTLRRKFSGEETQALASLHKNVHTASRVDYLSHHPRTEMPSSSTSRISSRIPRPLSNTDTAHQFSQNTTFDTFLVPHKSGKGEAYRNALNAKEVKVGTGLACLQLGCRTRRHPHCVGSPKCVRRLHCDSVSRALV